jgi:hypothetical protein
MGKLANLALDSLPTFKCLVPSLGKMITLRSFVTKEQKLLMIAKQSEGDDQLDNIVNAVTQLIQNCVTSGDINIGELPSFDLEYIYIQLHMHSTGTTQSKSFYLCKAPVLDDEGNQTLNENQEPITCDQANGVVVSLKEAKVATSEISKGIIEVKSATIEKLILKYPNFEQITRHDVGIAEDDIDATMAVYAECMTYLYKADGSVLKYGEDYEADDALEFLELMPQTVFDEVIAFFTNIPSVSGHADFTCRKCGHHAKIELRGLQDFF